MMSPEDKIEVIYYLKDIKEYIKQVFDKNINPLRSKDIDKLAESFAQAKQEYPVIKQHRVVHGSPYSTPYDDLHAILVPLNPILGKYGLAFNQYQDEVDDKMYLFSELLHSSGQWKASKVRVVLGTSDEDSGKTLAYHKRQQAKMLLGISIQNDPDDDNADAETNKRILSAAKTNTYQVPPAKARPNLTKEQIDMLDLELAGRPALAQEIKTHFNINHLADLPAENFIGVLTHVRTLISNEKYITPRNPGGLD